MSNGGSLSSDILSGVEYTLPGRLLFWRLGIALKTSSSTSAGVCSPEFSSLTRTCGIWIDAYFGLFRRGVGAEILISGTNCSNPFILLPLHVFFLRNRKTRMIIIATSIAIATVIVITRILLRNRY